MLTGIDASDAAGAFEPAYGRPVSVMPGLARITCRNPGVMTGPGTNTYLAGDGPIAVIDPGPEDDDHRKSIEKSLDGRDVCAVLLTHRHKDHCAGARTLADRLKAPIVACDPALRRCGFDGAIGVDRALRPDDVLADCAVMSLGSIRLKAHFTPGHGCDHLCFEVEGPGGRRILSGDHVMAWSTTIIAPPYGHMGDFMASLRRLLAMPETPFLPGHGAEIEAPHSHMRALLNHRRARERAILRRVAKGNDALEAITRGAYPHLDAAMLPAAGLSTLAHLEHLIETGAVETADGRYRVKA